MKGIATLWNRAMHWRRDELAGRCDRVEVLQHVTGEGAMTPRYALMTVLSCGIATLGLLQNSVAVVIGAMLISPLMGPIIALGMGLAVFDLRAVGRALVTLAIGLVLALAMATAIVMISPLKDATPEILARTEPTLFDLLIAIFSGLAGAYATITRKGETIVGVAIATALMPPLAVVGYGLALGNLHVAGGAGFLFMTNLLAIALSVTVVARVYGFAGSDSQRQTVWQAVLIVGTFVVLSLPLGLALRKIVIRTHIEHVVRSALDETASAASGRVTTLHVDAASEPLLVDAVFMTPHFVAGLDKQLEEELHRTLHRGVQVNLREVVTTSDDADALRRSTMAELRKSVDELREAEAEREKLRIARQDSIEQARQAVLSPLGELQSLNGGSAYEMRLRADSGVTLESAYDLEQSARLKDKSTRISVIPPLLPLLPIAFAKGAVELDAEGQRSAAIDAWALARWSAGAVSITGYAPGNNEKIARQRAEAVAVLLRKQSVPISNTRGVAVRHRSRSADSSDRVEISLGSK